MIANAGRKNNLAKVRELLHVRPAVEVPSCVADVQIVPVKPTYVCQHCGASMIIIGTFVRGQAIRAPPQQRGTA